MQDKALQTKESVEKEVADRGKRKEKGADIGKSQELGNPHRYFYIYRGYKATKILVKTYQK